ncbi:MAG: tetratricopeptide repeat protein [archaeon]|nr:tetratricopeptide repeat protein [archaeon]
MDLWSAILKADGTRNPENRIKALSSVLNKVLDYETNLDSKILCRLIRIVSAEEAQGWDDDVRDLVSKSRPRDCRPALTAASCFARKGLVTEADAIIGELGEAPDKAFYHYVSAEIDIARNDQHSARNHLMKALWSDKTYHEAYMLLSKIDSTVNWAALEACELLAIGRPFDEPEDDGSPELTLYRLYREWYRGNRETAGRMLISSEGYQDRVPVYCVLSARMSRDERDWHSCQMVLSEASAAMENDVSILCELGDAYLNGGSNDLALASFRSAEAFDIANPRVVKGMIRSCMALDKKNEAQQAIVDYLDSEFADYDDYIELTRFLLDMGFNDDAAMEAKKILFSHPDDATACIILSKVALLVGDYRAAEAYAKDGVDANKKNAESMAQLARVYLAIRRTGKAASVAKKAVSIKRDCIPALEALVDVYKETGDNDRAVEACRSILEIDPGNTGIANILSTLELAKALNGSESSDSMPHVVGEDDFVKLISVLISEGKYTEAEKLCRDNDHKYGGVKEVRRLRGNAEYALGEYLKASASFASAAVLMKNDSEIWHSKGLADEKFGDLDSAEEAFGKAILLDMYNPQYWISNGCIKEKKGDLDAAIKSFNRAIELDPRSSYALVRKAAIFAGNGMFSEALNFLELAEATDSKNTDILAVKMKVCIKAARYTDAAFIGKKLMKKNPDASIVAAYARANMGLMDTASAKKVLDKALASDPDSLELLFAYRDLTIQMGDTEETIDVCHEILRLEPMDRSTKRALADALMKVGKSDEANLIFNSIGNESGEEKPSEETQDPVALFNIAKSMLEAGDLVSAARLTDRALETDPDNLDYSLFRAVIYRKSGDKRVADMFLSQYLDRNPTNGSVHEAIGDMRTEDGDIDGAIKAYSKAIQKGITNPQIYIKLGNVQEAKGAYTAAVKSYSTAFMLDPHDADASRFLAYTQYRTKDYDAALRSIQSSITSEPSGEAYAILAMIYQVKKDRAGVRDAYQGFLRFDNVGEEWTRNVVTALNSVGLRTEAMLLKSRPGMLDEEIEETVDVPVEVKRLSERIMRRAYMLGVEVSDPIIAESIGSDAELAGAAVSYLRDIPSYGEVLYGTNECDHLENLSFQTISRAKTKDLEALRIAEDYVASGAKDVDEAKRLMAYLRAARVSKLPRETPGEYVMAAAHVAKDKSIEQVMLDEEVGIFAARMILSVAESHE